MSPEKPLGAYGPVTLCLPPAVAAVYERERAVTSSGVAVGRLIQGVIVVACKLCIVRPVHGFWALPE